MTQVLVTANLPFPVRVNDAPYRVESAHAIWSLQFKLVRQSSIDPRIGCGGTLDLEIDRSGFASYSKVTGSAKFADPVTHDEAVSSFLDALNALISHVRDVLGMYWIRTIERADLYQETVVVDGQGLASLLPGRIGALTLPIIGISKEVDSALRSALVGSALPPVWRQIQLDAQDALEAGRYEDAVILGWCSLESACRRALPGLAYKCGLKVEDLLTDVVPARKKRPPRSFEEVVERVSNGLVLVRQAAELVEPKMYDPAAIKRSAQVANSLRNKVVHQGVRISRRSAQEALRSLEHALHVLRLRDVPPPPPALSWERRFGRVSEEVANFIEQNHLRLVLAYPKNALFAVEWLPPELWVRIADDVDETTATAILLIECDTKARIAIPGRPYLVADSRSPWLTGLAVDLVRQIESAVCRAEALLSASRTSSSATELAKYALKHIVNKTVFPSEFHPLDFNNVVTLAHAAAYAAGAPEENRRELAKLGGEHAVKCQRWAECMALIDPQDDHGRCAVYRTIHADCLWLDSITVVCPTEKATFGSRRTQWPEEGHP